MNIYYEFREIRNTSDLSTLMNISAIVKYLPRKEPDHSHHPGYACVLDGYAKAGELFTFMPEWLICETTASTLREFQEEKPEYFL